MHYASRGGGVFVLGLAGKTTNTMPSQNDEKSDMPDGRQKSVRFLFDGRGLAENYGHLETDYGVSFIKNL